MSGLERLRAGLGRAQARFGRARMAVGKCGELRRHGPVRAWSEGSMFARPGGMERPEEAPRGPSFGSWF